MYTSLDRNCTQTRFRISDIPPSNSSLQFRLNYKTIAKYSDIESFLAEKSLIFIFEYAICSPAQLKSIFISFVSSQLIEANNRPRGQSEGWDTLIFQCRWRCQRAFVARVSEGVFSRSSLFAFSAQPLDVEKYTRGWKKWKSERNKLETSPDLRSGFGNTSWDVTLIPQAFAPRARNITVLWPLLHSIIMIVSDALKKMLYEREIRFKWREMLRLIHYYLFYRLRKTPIKYTCGKYWK